MAGKNPFPPAAPAKKGKVPPQFAAFLKGKAKGKKAVPSKGQKSKARAAAIARMAAKNPSDKPPASIQNFLQKNGQ
jgi:hypothetical protein